MHIGLDTVEIKEKLFELQIAKDETVEKGQLLCTFDIDSIKQKGYDIASPIVITNSGDYENINPINQQHIEAGNILLTVDNNELEPIKGD